MLNIFAQRSKRVHLYPPILDANAMEHCGSLSPPQKKKYSKQKQAVICNMRMYYMHA